MSNWSHDFYFFYTLDAVLSFPYLHNAMGYAKANSLTGYVICPDGERVEITADVTA